MRLLSIACVLIAFTASAPAAAQTPLPLGSATSGTATGDQPAVYTLTVDSAGLLSVAVKGTEDLTLTLTDADGQPVPEGTADRDLHGSTGTEILSAPVGAAGGYRLVVNVLGGGASRFEIAANFVAFPAFEQPADPDGKPSDAITLDVGAAHEDSLDTAQGDHRDWFVFTPSQDATLAIATRAPAGNEIDLALDVYLGGDFETPVTSSDQDQQDDTANEAVTVVVKAGQPVHVRVSTPVGQATGPYRIASSLIGGR